jgi:hypothetical protein
VLARLIMKPTEWAEVWVGMFGIYNSTEGNDTIGNCVQLWPKARVLSPLARRTTGVWYEPLRTPCRKQRGVPLGKGGQM